MNQPLNNHLLRNICARYEERDEGFFRAPEAHTHAMPFTSSSEEAGKDADVRLCDTTRFLMNRKLGRQNPSFNWANISPSVPVHPCRLEVPEASSRKGSNLTRRPHRLGEPDSPRYHPDSHLPRSCRQHRQQQQLKAALNKAKRQKLPRLRDTRFECGTLPARLGMTHKLKNKFLSEADPKKDFPIIYPLNKPCACVWRVGCNVLLGPKIQRWNRYSCDGGEDIPQSTLNPLPRTDPSTTPEPARTSHHGHWTNAPVPDPVWIPVLHSGFCVDPPVPVLNMRHAAATRGEAPRPQRREFFLRRERGHHSSFRWRTLKEVIFLHFS